MANELLEYKARLHDPLSKKYTVMDRGSVKSIDAIIEKLGVRRVRIVMDDFVTLTLIRDEAAEPGQKVDTYA